MKKKQVQTVSRAMKWYPDRIPDWISNLFSCYTWHGNREEKNIYLTFDDGPTPEVTEFVLRQLSIHNFTATFFCIGDKVNRFPNIYDQLLEEGHRTGNHTYNHLDACYTKTDNYLENVMNCSEIVRSQLFRPPYGRIKRKITKELIEKGYKIILWDVLSGDFDKKRSVDSCLRNLKKNTRNGSIVVFHDSDKSFEKLKVLLPAYLRYLKDNQWKSYHIN